MMDGSTRRVIVCVAASAWLLAACPVDEPPPQMTSGPPGGTGEPEPPPPTPEGSICDQVVQADAPADGGELLADCPGSVADAINIEWLPDAEFNSPARSYVHFAVENLTARELRVEFEAKGQQQDSEQVTLAIPLKDLEPGRRYVHAVDLQMGAFFYKVFESGIVDVQVFARIVEPTKTEWQLIGDLEVEIEVDSDSRIYRSQLVRW